jgi:hypothetical protein
MSAGVMLKSLGSFKEAWLLSVGSVVVIDG